MSVCPADSPDCGYVSDGDEQADWEHMYWEHRTCTECGAEPRDGDSVTHRAACPRLQPEYRYPSDECDLCPTPCMCPESQLQVEG